MLMAGCEAAAQVNVVTAHNDIARTGQNLQETILTPTNVNPTQFGLLFSQLVRGSIHAQPLYVYQLTIGGAVHNVVYVATSSDVVYAFDADTNGGTNANPLWETSLVAGTILTYLHGVLGTPVVDLSSNTIYLVSSESQGSTPIYRLHALDITTGVEKFGGPVQIGATIAGTGSGSSGGVLTFDAANQVQRPGLLYLNGIVYVAFGSNKDENTWHGWIFSYGLNATTQTLQQIDVFCTSADSDGAGIWMGGAGLAAEVRSATKPYGRMFVATGNGTYGISAPTVSGQPYSNPSNEYGMSVLNLDLTGGVMTVEDEFTPYDEAALSAKDVDLGSGGPVLLPEQTTATGSTFPPLVEIGKSGTIYILDRNNLGGFNTTWDQVIQEVRGPANWGVWGTEAYWNNSIYFGGTGANGTTRSDNLTAYSFVKGVLSTTPTSKSAEQFAFPGPTLSVSANGATNGIVWATKTDSLDSPGVSTLQAFNATNLANTIYSSNDNLSRDSPGVGSPFIVPTIANGKVYVGANGQLSVYGLLGVTPIAPAPVITPSSESYSGTVTVTITDAISGATIYYTTNSSTPNSSSLVYAGPFTISSNETITAIASPNGYLQSAPASATYVSTGITANPVFSLVGGTYTSPQSVAIRDTTAGATIYYTTDGTTPKTSSTQYSGAIMVSTSETVQAIAVASGFANSAVVSATYTINLPQAATPTFSVPGGTYTSPQSVAISDATAGATIYYTTDGTTPTTSSTQYSGAIMVSASETVQAIAVASGFVNSSLGTATYTINLPPSFTIASSLPSLTVAAGQTGTTTISVTPSNGFNSTVSFACSGLPSGATCSFSPATITPSGSAASTMLTVATSATAAALDPGRSALLPLTLGFFAWKTRRRWQMLFLLVLVTVGLGMLSGCGGGSMSSGSSSAPQSSTSTITVTATAGALQQTTSFSLTVN
jgi:hypothetical protein